MNDTQEANAALEKVSGQLAQILTAIQDAKDAWGYQQNTKNVFAGSLTEVFAPEGAGGVVLTGMDVWDVTIAGVSLQAATPFVVLPVVENHASIVVRNPTSADSVVHFHFLSADAYLRWGPTFAAIAAATVPSLYSVGQIALSSNTVAVQLPNVPCKEVQIQNSSGSGVAILWGTEASQVMELPVGSNQTLPATNANLFWVILAAAGTATLNWATHN